MDEKQKKKKEQKKDVNRQQHKNPFHADTNEQQKESNIHWRFESIADSQNFFAEKRKTDSTDNERPTIDEKMCINGRL